MTKSSFKSKNYTSKEILEIIHTDLYGPIEVESYKGDEYFMLTSMTKIVMNETCQYSLMPRILPRVVSSAFMLTISHPMNCGLDMLLV